MRLFLLAFLAGCLPPPRYVIADVTSRQAPVADALVAADCGQFVKSAGLTDDLGRARLRFHREFDASRCLLVAAKPGFSTVEVPGVSSCTGTPACEPMQIELAPTTSAGAR